MKVINFAEEYSLISQYMTELRDVNMQGDMLRFRHNLQRIGEIRLMGQNGQALASNEARKLLNCHNSL